MERVHREALRKNWVFMMDNLVTDELLDHLLGDNIITHDNYEEIRVEKTRKDKASTLLFILQRRGPQAFGQFLLGLRNTEQGFIADRLVQTVNEDNQNQPMQL